MEGSSDNDTAATVATTPTASVDSTPETVDSTPATVDGTPATVNTSTTATDCVKTPPATPSTATSASSHGADPVLLNQLLEMGVATNLAIRALLLSGNSSVEAAFTWLSDLSAEEADALALRSVEEDAGEWEDLEEVNAEDPGYKMVLVVDTSLGMKPGKMAAQVGHAVLGLFRVLKRNATRHRNSLAKWENYGYRRRLDNGQRRWIWTIYE